MAVIRPRSARTDRSTAGWSSVTLARLEDWLPLLRERLRTFGRVLGAPERAREERLQPETVGEWKREPANDRLLRRPDGQRSPLAERLRPPPGRRKDLCGRHDGVYQPDAMRLLGGAGLAHQDHLHRLGERDRPRQTLRAPRPRHDGPADLGEPESG